MTTFLSSLFCDGNDKPSRMALFGSSAHPSGCPSLPATSLPAHRVSNPTLSFVLMSILMLHLPPVQVLCCVPGAPHGRGSSSS